MPRPIYNIQQNDLPYVPPMNHSLHFRNQDPLSIYPSQLRNELSEFESFIGGETFTGTDSIAASQRTTYAEKFYTVSKISDNHFVCHAFTDHLLSTQEHIYPFVSQVMKPSILQI